MAIFKQLQKERLLTFIYGSCEEECSNYDITQHSDKFNAIYEFDNSGNSRWYKPGGASYFNELKCGHTYFAILNSGEAEFEIPNAEIGSFENDNSLVRYTYSCQPITTPTPTPKEKPVGELVLSQQTILEGNGLANGDGTYSRLSSDGETLCVWYTLQKEIRVFNKESNEWVQNIPTIVNIETPWNQWHYADFGFQHEAFCINRSADTIAIVEKTERVRIYSNTGTEFVQIGDDIAPELQAAQIRCIALSEDGRTIAISAANGVHNSPNNTYARFWIFKYENSVWTQKGNMYSNSTEYLRNMQINKDASSIVLCLDSNQSLEIKSFSWSESENKYIETSSPIDLAYRGGFDFFGGISSWTGQNLVIATPNLKHLVATSFKGRHVSVHSRENDNAEWVQKGKDIFLTDNSPRRLSVTISDDADIVVIGDYVCNSFFNCKNRNWVKVYGYNKLESEWQQIGETISPSLEDSSAFSFMVHLSGNGKRFVISSANSTELAIYEIS